MWVVCKFFDDGSLFVNSKKAREVMAETLKSMGEEMESEVIKEFDTYEEARSYKIQMEEIDDKLNKIL